jgi:hypothetical protein
MTPALPGEHLCVAHQGNHSHYAEHNCVICKLTAENAKLTEELELKFWAELEFKSRAEILRMYKKSTPSI